MLFAGYLDWNDVWNICSDYYAYYNHIENGLGQAGIHFLLLMTVDFPCVVELSFSYMNITGRASSKSC